MKRKIDARSGTAGLLGRDVKLGKGGIREIEFIVQTLSLVWAGQARPWLPGFATLDRRRSVGLAVFAPLVVLTLWMGIWPSNFSFFWDATVSGMVEHHQAALAASHAIATVMR